jgi:hypothetical protein
MRMVSSGLESVSEKQNKTKQNKTKSARLPRKGEGKKLKPGELTLDEDNSHGETEGKEEGIRRGVCVCVFVCVHMYMCACMDIHVCVCMHLRAHMHGWVWVCRSGNR